MGRIEYAFRFRPEAGSHRDARQRPQVPDVRYRDQDLPIAGRHLTESPDDAPGIDEVFQDVSADDEVEWSRQRLEGIFDRFRLDAIEDPMSLGGTLRVDLNAHQMRGPVGAQPRRIAACATSHFEDPFAVSPVPLE